MASETNLFNNPDISVWAGWAATAVVVVATAVWCTLKSQKPSPPPKDEAMAKDTNKGKGVKAAQQQKKGKQEDKKSKPEKKNIALKIDHPLWISSSSTGSEIVGFAYDVRCLCTAIFFSYSLFNLFTSFTCFPGTQDYLGS